MLPTVSGTDLGCPEEPGEYEIEGASYIVNTVHVEAWRDSPDSLFRTVLLTKLGDRSLRFAVGAPVDERP